MYPQTYVLATPINATLDGGPLEEYNITVSRREDGMIEGRCSDLGMYEAAVTWEELEPILDQSFQETLQYV